eukprot:8483810-Lingulodinium_polyedra.AAC.1
MPCVPGQQGPVRGRLWAWVWGTHAGGKMAPMMRAQGQAWPLPFGPPSQRAAPTLLYHADSAGHEQPW